jgi:hypothetical protein
MHQLCQLIQTLIGHVYKADIWFNGTKTVIARLRFCAAANGIEKG